MRISDNRRYLVEDDGAPFFYLADTAWGFFYQASTEEAEHYLRVRQEQGFTVIMPVLVWEDLPRTKDYYGRWPFLENDPTRPDEAFFRHVDHLVGVANGLGMTMAMLPSWGSYVAPPRREGDLALLTPDNARAYGEFLGQRYADARVIWVLGGDRNLKPDQPEYAQVWEEMALGLDAGNGGGQLMTFHPTGAPPCSSSQWYHESPWLDYHMFQTSTRLDLDYCNTLLADYNRQPVKPFVDGETRYEHSHRFFLRQMPYGVRMTPQRVRQAAYYALLCGALGHTYGCRDVWSFYVPSARTRDRDVDIYWRDALHLPAAEQLRHLKALFTEYPWYNLVPDQDGSLVCRGSMEGNLRIQGALARDGSYALVYIPEPMPVWIDLSRLSRGTVDASWFEPTTGRYTFFQRYHDAQTVRFAPEDDAGDRVLVLAARSIPA
jgi:hypothetical protein